MFMKGSCPSLGFALPFCVDCDVIDTAAKRVRMLETRAKIYVRKGMGMTIFP